jgi:hypothetical protein
VWIIAGCKREKQDWQYAALNKVSIATDDSSFTITQMDTLRIVPRLTESKPEGATYTYEWTITPEAADDGVKPVVLSGNQDLEAMISVAPGKYLLRYYVTNTRTGIKTLMQYNLLVNGGFYEGYLVTSNKNGKGMLSFIRMDSTVFPEPATGVNNKVYPGKAIAAYAGIADKLNQILYFTDKGIYRFNADDFTETGSDNNIVSAPQNWGDKAYYGISGNLTDQYLINNGGLYAALAPMFVSVEEMGPFSDRIPGDYELYPYVITSTSQFGCYFYDNKYKRFMKASYLSRELTVASGINASSFSMANVGKTMIGCDYTSAGEFYCVMKDADQYYLYSVTTNKSPYAGIAQPFLNSPDIEKASAFAVSSVLKQLYYAAGNKIYLYDVLANSSRLVYQLPDEYEIRDMKMYKRIYLQFNTSPLDPMHNKRLVVAANKGDEGEVFFFALNSLGDISGNTFTHKFTGFGEISQINYRNR